MSVPNKIRAFDTAIATIRDAEQPSGVLDSAILAFRQFEALKNAFLAANPDIAAKYSLTLMHDYRFCAFKREDNS